MNALTARITENRQPVYDLLVQDAVTCAYMLADLEESYNPYSTWYVAGPDDRLESVLLVYTALSLPVVITYGQSGALQQIIRTFRHELPGHALVHLQPHHVAAIDSCFAAEGLVPMLRMGLDRDAHRPLEESTFEVESLSHRHTGEIIELYQHYPDNFFEPSQLESEHYCGIRADGALVSVAGVHAVSPTAGIATLGNIVTHPDYRARGMSTACTDHVCRQLFAEGIDTLALNVSRQNRFAVRVYENLGFRYHDTYLEGLVNKSAGAVVGP